MTAKLCTMDIADCGLPERFRTYLEAEGIGELYPPQAAAVQAGVTEGDSVVAAVPTAGGKTLIATLAMLSTVGRGGTALYVVPLRALGREKYESFAAIPGISVGIATGEYDDPESGLDGHDIVVATSEKVDAAIRHGEGWVERVDCAVIDEIHLVDDAGRGTTLEVTIAKLRTLTPDIQLVGLSATIPNADAIADWLDASLVESDWRPVDLECGVHDGDGVEYEDDRYRDLPATTPTRALVREAIEEGGGCLVFVGSRKAAGSLAGDLAGDADLAASLGGSGSVAERVEATAQTATGEHLAELVSSGVAFHHAGLRPDHRRAVEMAFRDRDIDVICATPTLAAGVNVPARRVVVRDWQRYDATAGTKQPLSPLEVHQMLGRAGRPGLDPYGEAIIVGDDDPAAVKRRYFETTPAPIESRLAEPAAMAPHVLSTVAGGFADSQDAVMEVLAGTFGAYQLGEATIAETAAAVIEDLDQQDMLVRTPSLQATELGDIVSEVYVDPTTGASVVRALERAGALPSITRLTVCEIVADTDEMPTRYVTDEEAGRLSTDALRHDEEIAKPVRELDDRFHAWLASFKTARVLIAYAEGEPADDISSRFGLGPGDVTRMAERGAWLMSATASLAELVDSPAQATIEETEAALTERLEADLGETVPA